MKAIFKKELSSYFYSPIGYVFIGAFLVISGVVFSMNVVSSSTTDMTYYFSTMSIFSLMLIPVLTMKLFAEEKRQKTDQLLLTAPVKISDIVLGKYFAAVVMFFAALVITAVYPFILSFYGPLPAAKMIGSYIGAFLLSAAFIAVGMFISALSENQMIASVATFAALLVIWIMDWFALAVNVSFLSDALGWFSILKRFEDFYFGVLNISSLIYFISFAGFFVFLTVMTTERRRWR